MLPEMLVRSLVIDEVLASPKAPFPHLRVQAALAALATGVSLGTRRPRVERGHAFKAKSLRALSSVPSFERGAYNPAWCLGLSGEKGEGLAVRPGWKLGSTTAQPGNQVMRV